MFVNPQEMLAFDHEGRQLRVPERGSWVEFDCTRCGTHTEEVIDGGALCCSGCDAFSFVPAEWAQPISRTCVKCGQTTLTSADPLCDQCYAAMSEPERFEADRLFTPAPAQIPGQLAL